VSSDKLSTAKRPLVITIIAILTIISGLLYLTGAFASPILIIGAIFEFVIALIIYAIITLYLFKPNVRAFFKI